VSTALRAFIVLALSLVVPPLARAQPVSDEGKPRLDRANLLAAFDGAQYFWQQTDAARQLAGLGDRSVIAAIEPTLATTDRRRRCNAAFVLAALGDERGIEILIGELEDTNAAGRTADGSPNGQVTADHPNVRVSAVHALRDIGDAAALPALQQALDDHEVTQVNAPTTAAAEAQKAIEAIRRSRP
jgi:HEAT repeat protein